MRSTRFDECINSKRLFRACEAEGRVIPFRFPEKWSGRGIKDPDVLKELLREGRLLVTTDGKIVRQHCEHIPNSHPGILIVAQDDGVARTITDIIVMQILSKFKAEFAEWDTAPWENSIIRLTHTYVEVQHVEDGQPDNDGLIMRDSAGWQESLKTILGHNASRKAIENSGSDESRVSN